MKRCGFGFALMGLLLVGCIAVMGWMERFQEPVRQNLELAREAALEEDWEAAQSFVQAARSRWEKNWRRLAAASDHSPMEELDILYAQLEVAARLRSRENFAALCATLSRCTETLAEAHRADWWNIL